MKQLYAPVLLFATCFFISCTQTERNTNTPNVEKQQMGKSESLEETENEMTDDDVLQITQKTDSARADIESKINEPIRLQTRGLRAKIQQKWQYIDFYVVEGALARIKTHPYENISKRTEEFYLRDGEIILAVIEDDGSGDIGKNKDELDKLYYFYNGQPIKEINRGSETEYNFKESDAEELLTEAKEYIELYPKGK